jgi:hypothetical protein
MIVLEARHHTKRKWLPLFETALGQYTNARHDTVQPTRRAADKWCRELEQANPEFRFRVAEYRRVGK